MRFRERYGMPFRLEPKERLAGTGRGCRAVVAARLRDPGSEWRVFRALQLANFTTPLLLDDDELIREALRALPGVDADAIVDGLDDEDVAAAYEQDKAETRSAAGTPAEAQDKTATSDGPVRYTAPSWSSSRTDRGSSPAAGSPCWPTTSSSRTSTRRSHACRRPRSGQLLAYFQDGLTTAEVAALLADGPDPVPDPEAAERLLVQLVGDGTAVREPLGDDALWRAA